MAECVNFDEEVLEIVKQINKELKENNLNVHVMNLRTTDEFSDCSFCGLCLGSQNVLVWRFPGINIHNECVEAHLKSHILKRVQQSREFKALCDIYHKYKDVVGKMGVWLKI